MSTAMPPVDGGVRRDVRRKAPLLSRVPGHMTTALTWAVVLAWFFPVLWMVLTGLKPESQAATNPPTWFFTPTLENYDAVVQQDVLSFLGHSLVVTVSAVILVLLFALPAAYGLAIRPMKGWRDVLFFFLSTRFMPLAAAIAPIFVIALKLGLFDTLIVLIILSAVSSLPIAIWMMRSFMSEVPREIVEAAQVDGANFWTVMRSVLIPLLAPGIGSVALICAIFTWNEFFLAVNLTATQAQTLPVFLVGFLQSEGRTWATLSAAATICAVPVVIAGWVAQNSLVRGLTLGAVK